MTTPRWGEEDLMAYADGAMDTEAAKALDKAVAEDPKLAAQIAALRKTRALATEALEPLLREPVPDALEARIREAAGRIVPEPVSVQSTVVPMRARRSAQGRPAMGRVRAAFPMAMAASVALAVGLGAGFWAGGQGTTPGLQLGIAGIENAPLLNALSEVASGDERGIGPDRFRAIATFRAGGEALCREFEIDRADATTTVAVACREEDGWETRFTIASASGADGYAPASSLDALQAYLTAVEASPPMDADEEAALLSELAN